jgi:WD40 repeat protein
MRKLKFILALVIINQLACGELGSAGTAPAAPASNAPPLVTASPVPEVLPSATLPEPTLAPPAALDPLSFAKAEPLHEYWPAVRKQLDLWDTARFGMSVTALDLSPDGRYIAVAGCDAEAGEGGPTSPTPPLPTRCETTLLGPEAHAYLYILDAQTEKIVATLPPTGQVVTVVSVEFSHHSDKLIYYADLLTDDMTSVSGKLAIWDVASGEIQAEFAGESSQYSVVLGGPLSHDDKWMIMSSPVDDYNFRTRIWDMQENQFVGDVQLSEPPGYLSADDQKLLTMGNPLFAVYDTHSWQKLSEVPLLPDDSHRAYDLSPDLSLMAVCDNRLDNRPIRIWDVATAALLQTLTGEWGKCGQVRFSPDGRWLLMFERHGAGPLVWHVGGSWDVVNDTFYKTNFVKDDDLFVDRIDFSQDGRTLLVSTFMRLTLYHLP